MTIGATPCARRIALAVMAAITLAIYWFGSVGQMNVSQYQNFLMGSRYAFAYLAGMEIRATSAVRFSPRMLALGKDYLLGVYLSHVP